MGVGASVPSGNPHALRIDCRRPERRTATAPACVRMELTATHSPRGCDLGGCSASRRRGRRSREQTRRQLLLRWRREYQASAAQPAAAVSAAQLAAGAIPLLLGALLPAGTAATRRVLAAGAALKLDALDREALRGTLALLLRSLASPDPEINYCAAAVGPSREVSGRGRRLRSASAVAPATLSFGGCMATPLGVCRRPGGAA